MYSKYLFNLLNKCSFPCALSSTFMFYGNMSSQHHNKPKEEP